MHVITMFIEITGIMFVLLNNGKIEFSKKSGLPHRGAVRLHFAPFCSALTHGEPDKWRVHAGQGTKGRAE